MLFPETGCCLGKLSATVAKRFYLPGGVVPDLVPNAKALDGQCGIIRVHYGLFKSLSEGRAMELERWRCERVKRIRQEIELLATVFLLRAEIIA